MVALRGNVTPRLVAFIVITAVFLIAAHRVFVTTRAHIDRVQRRADVPIGVCKYNPSSPSSNSLPWNNWTDTIRTCLLARIAPSNAVRSTMHEAVAACVGEPCWRMMDVWMLPNLSDLKFAILPYGYAPPTNHQRQQQNPQSPKVVVDCTAVTLGIGNDIYAELGLQQLLPMCKFYGADPVRVVSRDYEPVLKGKYFETAVVGTGGGPNEAMLTNDGWNYRRETLPNSISLSDFLLFNVSQKTIDYLFLDNEGAELGILEQLAYNGSLDRNGIVVCQMSIEFHSRPVVWPPMGVDECQFARIAQTLIGRSPMMPLWVSPPALHAAHQIAYYINTQHPYCVKKFFSVRS